MKSYNTKIVSYAKSYTLIMLCTSIMIYYIIVKYSYHIWYFDIVCIWHSIWYSILRYHDVAYDMVCYGIRKSIKSQWWGHTIIINSQWCGYISLSKHTVWDNSLFRHERSLANLLCRSDIIHIWYHMSTHMILYMIVSTYDIIISTYDIIYI